MANEDIKISELPNGLVDEDSLFPTAQPDGLGDFSTAKISTTDIGNYVATEQQYSDLGGKTLVQAISSAGGGGDLEDLDDVTITNPSDGDTIVYDATQQVWVNGQGSVVGDLDDLTDVDLSTPTNGQVLTYDATQQVWVNATPTASASGLGDLGDVTLTSEAEGEALAYDATNQVWKNKKIVKGMTQTDYDNLQTKDPNTLYVTDGTLPSGTIASNDILAFTDVSDSNKPKSTTAAAVAGLATAEIYNQIHTVNLNTMDIANGASMVIHGQRGFVIGNKNESGGNGIAYSFHQGQTFISKAIGTATGLTITRNGDTGDITITNNTGAYFLGIVIWY